MPPMIPIVVGANGISGTAQISLLLSLPESEVPHVIGLSRRPPNEKFFASLGDKRARLSWVSVDLLLEDGENRAIEELRKDPRGKDATHVLYMAYMDDGTPAMNGKNADMFRRSLRAADAVCSLEFVLLQIGLGVYGGTASKRPWREDRCAGPNARWNKYFYTPQMEFLKSFSRGKRWEGKWTVTAPSIIFGAASQAAMNFGVALAVYASCKAVLGEPMVFPGSAVAYEAWQDATDVKLLAEFNLWAMREPKCRGEMLNMTNGDLFNWALIWPVVAEEFGAVVPEDQFRDVPKDVKAVSWRRFSIEKEMAAPYPAADSKTSKAEYAWKLLCEQDPKLDPKGWTYAPLDFVDQTILFGSLASMNKAKSFGWTGWRDTERMLSDQIAEMRSMGLVPNVKIVPQGGSAKLGKL